MNHIIDRSVYKVYVWEIIYLECTKFKNNCTHTKKNLVGQTN